MPINSAERHVIRLNELLCDYWKARMRKNWLRLVLILSAFFLSVYAFRRSGALSK